jgi:hypothetical protein
MNKYYKILGAILVVLLIAWLIYLIPKTANSPQTNNNQNNNINNNQQDPVVTDFASCVAAGYPILESFPEQCKTPDGRTFVNETEPSAEAEVYNIQSGQLVTSPLNIMGRARGNWFFEDNLPMTLKDQNGKVLAQKGFQSKDGNWMTTDFVEFEGRLDFATPTTEFGTLVIQRDNPSGLEENDKAISIPVRFR